MRQDVVKFQTLVASRLKTVFSVFSAYLLKTSHAKKELAKVHGNYVQASAVQAMRLTFDTWRKRSARRAAVYVFATDTRSLIESILVRSSRAAKSKSFYDLRLWTKQLARCQKIASRIENKRQKDTLQRSFERLTSNAKWSVSCRRALNLLAFTLKATSTKREALADIKQRANRRTFHFECAKHLLLSIRKVSKRVAFEGITQWASTRQRQAEAADTYFRKVKSNQKRRIYNAWHRILLRRQQLESKGEVLAANCELRLMDSVYRKWQDSVLNNKFSLYGREQALSKCLWQARAISAIDTMISVSQVRKERKRQIVAWLVSIDRLMFQKLADKFLRNALKTAEFKDNLEFHIEKIQMILVRQTFSDIRAETKSSKLASALVAEFRLRHSKNLFVKRYANLTKFRFLEETHSSEPETSASTPKHQ